MVDINEFALKRAETAAAKLWAFGSASYPLRHHSALLLQRQISDEVTDTAIAFAIHVRRLLDNSGVRTKFQLDQPFRKWAPAPGLKRERSLREALNRIVHATDFEVGFEKLPESVSTIGGGSIGVIFLKTRTDQKETALVDVFSLASCFFDKLVPIFSRPPETAPPDIVN